MRGKNPEMQRVNKSGDCSLFRYIYILYIYSYLSLSIIFNRGISLFNIIFSGNIISCTNSAP